MISDHDFHHAGDEYNMRFRADMEEIIDMVDSPEQACTLFLEIVKTLFELDNQGRRKFLLIKLKKYL